MKEVINYDLILQKSLRNVVKEILSDVSKNGLPGKHHFYITFATSHPWVKIPDYLLVEYPDEMVIVLEHEYWDLEVNNDGFYVTLCFDEVNERIYIPFVSLINFVDPSVKFGLQLIPEYEEEKQFKNNSSTEHDASLDTNVKDTNKNSGNVISLDDFRKK